MNKKVSSDLKQNYDVARHHAWAGSVMLAVLIAVRGFLELSKIDIDDRIIVVIGMILVFYVLFSVFLTYKYRSALSIEQKKVVEVKIEPEDSSDLEKERLKLEKKKIKAEMKVKKKSSK